MLTEAASGFLTILVAGLLQGTILTPMKYLRSWRWENIWLVYASFAYLLFPWAFALATVPHILRTLGAAPAGGLVRTLVFGFLWGLAVVLFGLGCKMLGLALGFAIIFGLGTSIGSLVPLVFQHRDRLFAPAGLGTIAGVVLLTVAVVMFSIAGSKRDKMLRGIAAKALTKEPVGGEGRFLLGLVICIVCGLLNPLYNIAFAYGSDIQAQAVRFGTSPANAGNAVWLLVANAGYFPSLLYCLFLLNKNDSWACFQIGGLKHWLLTSSMALMWISGTVLYGVGANLIGDLGPVIGWPLLMSTMVLIANFWGFVAGEWKGVQGSPIRLTTAGLTILVAAMFMLGWSGRF